MRKILVLVIIILVNIGIMGVWYFHESIGLVDEHPERLTKAWLNRKDQIQINDRTFSEEERIEIIGNEPDYYKMKFQPWNVEESNVPNNKNSLVFLQSIENVDLSKVFKYTYWDVTLEEIKTDLSKYIGENVFFNNCTLSGVETIGNTTKAAKEIANGCEFYIVKFSDKYGNDGVLYLLSPYGRSMLPLYEAMETPDLLISGWPLGTDQEDRLVLAY